MNKGLAFLATCMSGASIESVTDDIGRTNQQIACSYAEFPRDRNEHPLVWRCLGFTFAEMEPRDRLIQRVMTNMTLASFAYDSSFSQAKDVMPFF